MLSIPHLIVIFIVALVVFGPEKLPELARNLGKVMAEFRRHTSDLRSSFEGHLRDLEREAETRRIAAPPAAQSTQQSSVSSTSAQPTASVIVPSNPPNAAAIAAARTEPAQVSEGAPTEEAVAGMRKHPGDDPYLTDLTNGEFAPLDVPGYTEPAEPEKLPERVTDGDVRSV